MPKQKSYETMLIPIILGRQPRNVRKNLAREYGNAEWTISKVQEAILKEITVLECGSLTYKGNVTEPHKSTLTTTLHAGASGRHSQLANSGTNKSTCIYCKGPHFCGRCDVVKDPQRRFELVKKGKHCFNCLGHHRASQCQSKLQCTVQTETSHQPMRCRIQQAN